MKILKFDEFVNEGFENMPHNTQSAKVNAQDQVNVEDHLTEGSKLIMNSDGTCDVEGGVDVSGLGLKSLKQLTPRIRKVSDDFACYQNKLTDLEGCPEEVKILDCSYNLITSLVNGPKNMQYVRLFLQ